MPSLQCHFCGAPVTIGEPIPRDSECESCRHDLRSCLNCRHYDTRYNNSCRETMAALVEDKERRNFCEYFYFNREPFQATGGSAAKQAQARTRLDALFGGKGGAGSEPPAQTTGQGPSETAKKKLESLFEQGRSGDRAGDARKKLDALFGEPKKPPDPDEKDS